MEKHKKLAKKLLAFYGTFLFTNNGRLIKCWDIFIYKPNQNWGHFHLQVTKPVKIFPHALENPHLLCYNLSKQHIGDE